MDNKKHDKRRLKYPSERVHTAAVGAPIIQTIQRQDWTEPEVYHVRCHWCAWKHTEGQKLMNAVSAISWRLAADIPHPKIDTTSRGYSRIIIGVATGKNSRKQGPGLDLPCGQSVQSQRVLEKNLLVSASTVLSTVRYQDPQRRTKISQAITRLKTGYRSEGDKNCSMDSPVSKSHTVYTSVSCFLGKPTVLAHRNKISMT